MGSNFAVRLLFCLPQSGFLSVESTSDAAKARHRRGYATASPRVRRAWLRVCCLAVLLLGGAAVVPLRAQTASFAGAVSTLGGGNLEPYSVAVDKSGNIYFGDAANSAVKEMPQGCSSQSCITTLGGFFADPTGVAVDGSGNVYVADHGTGNVYEMSPGCASSSCVTTLGKDSNPSANPMGVAVDKSGNVYVADETAGVVYEMPPNCTTSACVTVLGGTPGTVFNPWGVAVDGSGNIYVAGGSETGLQEMTPGCTSSSCVTTLAGGFTAPNGVAVDGNGNIFVADTGANAVKEMPSGCASSSCVTTLGGGFNQPYGLAVDKNGDVYVADTMNRSLKEIQTQGVNLGATAVGTTSPVLTLYFTFTSGGGGISTSVVTQGAQGLDFANAETGTCDTRGTSHVYNPGDTCTVNVTFAPKYAGTRYGAVNLANGTGSVHPTAYLYGTGVGPQLVFSSNIAQLLGGGFFNGPWGAAVDAAGNVYVADFNSDTVKKIPAGCMLFTCVSTVGPTFGGPAGVAVDGSGNLYIANYLSNDVEEMPPGCTSSSCVTTLGGGFSQPDAVAVDGYGNVYIADLGNNAVKEMPPGCTSSSCVSTLGDGFRYPEGVAVDGSGNVYVAHGGGSDAAVSEMPPGCASSACVSTLGGGFYLLQALALDGSGDIYVIDEGLKEMSPGCMSSACVTTLGYPADPMGVAVDGSGNVYITESTQKAAVLEVPFATPPNLSFADTAIGSESSDSPRTVTLRNIGNAPLTFPVPGTGENPSVSANFTLDASTTCPEVLTSSSASTLAAGASCNLALDFVPTIAGLVSGAVVLTDNTRNASPSVTQSIGLSGNGLSPTLTPTVTVTPASSTINTSQNLSVTVTVTGSSGNPTGTVLLTIPGDGTFGENLVSGSATFNIFLDTIPPSVPIGTFTITASYSGDSNYVAGTGSAVITRTKTTPTISVSANPPSITTLQSTVISAEIGSPQMPTGGVTVTIGGVTVGSGSLGGGRLLWGITVPGSALPLGTDTLTVTYSGDDLYSSVSATTTVTVAAPDYPVYTAQSAYNFGAINLGGTTSTSITMTFSATQTVGSTAVVTQGAQGLDFTNAGGGTCDTNGSGHVYNAGDSCTVNVMFTPKYAGARYGSVQLLDTSGKLLASALLQGAGLGPQLVFPNNPTIQTVGGGSVYYGSVAVDGSGNIYVADGSVLEKIPPGCNSSSCIITLGGGFGEMSGVAVDGSGNVYVADQVNSYSAVKEMSSDCDSAGCVAILAGGFVGISLRGIAVDGTGNVYISDDYHNVVTEIPRGCTSSGCFTNLGGGFSYPEGVAVDGSNNVYVSDGGNNAVKMIPAGCTLSSCVTTLAGGFNNPYTLAVDGTGNVYVGDAGNTVVKEMAPGCTSSSCVTTMNFGLGGPIGILTVDGRGNLYIADRSKNVIDLLNLAAPPSLSFAKTSAGSQSGPQSVTLRNVGNAPLTFPVPGSGQNPSVSANFTLDSSTTCPEVTSSSSAGTLAAGASCNLAVDFTPATSGQFAGSVTLTDNDLNASPSTTQSIALSGETTDVTDLTPYIQVNGGPWQQTSTVAVHVGDTVNLGPQPVSGGSWSWTGPNGFTSTSRGLNGISLTSASNVYTATYTNAGGVNSTQAFTITINPTPIVPYLQVNGGVWQQASNAAVHVGDTVNLGPQPVSGGTWTWTGPNGFASTTREIDAVSLTAARNIYTATYTNTSGVQSSLAFTITINPTPIVPYIQVNGGAWQQIASVTVNAGDTVNLGPQPQTGGTWSWTEPEGYTSTVRVLSSIVLPSGTNVYTATYTNANGVTSTQTFTITVNPTPIVPYLQVNGGAWQQAASVTVNAGDTVNLGPQPQTGGTWSWTGPNGFTSTSRVLNSVTLPSGTNVYTAIYTNTDGVNSTQAFTITVNPTPIVPYLQVNGGAWQQASTTAVNAGDTVNLGPQPQTGGTWSWTGPNGFTSTLRELNAVPLTSASNVYTATYTNASGVTSTRTFTITSN